MTVYRDECRHFNGIGGIGDRGHGKCCRAGVNYRQLVGGDDFGWARRLPCLEGSPSMPRLDPVTCPQFVLMTQEEHEAREAGLRAAIDKALADIAAGKCHICGLPAEPSRLVGRCRYNACGHRRGQEALADEDDA